MESDIPYTAINDPNIVLDRIPDLAEQHDYLVIDGPAGLQESVRAILLRTDLAICPTRLATEAYTVLEQSGLKTLKTIVYQRQVVADAPGQSSTVFEMTGDAAKAAAKEYQALFKEIMGMLP